MKPRLVLGSAQKNRYVGDVESWCSCVTAACGMGGGQIPMIIEEYEESDTDKGAERGREG